LLHQVGDLFELNVKLRCQKVKHPYISAPVVSFETHCAALPVTCFRIPTPYKAYYPCGACASCYEFQIQTVSNKWNQNRSHYRYLH